MALHLASLSKRGLGQHGNGPFTTPHPPPPTGDSLLWPMRVCAAEQGMVFKVLSLKQAI